MPFRFISLPLTAAALLFAGLAMAETTGDPLAARVSTNSPRLPSTVLRTKGGQPITVSAAGRATCPTTSPAEAAASLAIINSVRAARGLSPVKTNPRLQRAAEAHACEMANRGVMSHAGASGSGPAARVKNVGYRPRLTAENIGAGHFDLNRVHREWIASPGHLANILIRDIDHHGIGYAVSADGKSRFWAALYAKPK